MKSIALLLCACGLAAPALSATITTLGLGRAQAISDNGGVVTGLGGFFQPWVWTPEGGMVMVPAAETFTTTVSGDGRVIGASTIDANGNFRMATQPFPLNGGGWNFVPNLGGAECVDSFISSGIALSGDGSLVGGSMPNGGCSGFDVGVTYTQSAGLVEWYSPFSSLSRIYGVSADGQTYYGEHYMDIEGSVSHHGCIFYANGNFEPISIDRFHGTLSAMNRAGTLVAGNYHPDTGNCYVWSSANGFRDLGPIDGLEFVFSQRPTSMTDDGGIVIGEAGDFWSRSPVIWIEGQNGQPLQTYLQSRGVTGIGSWTFLSAAAITPDGRYIVGHYAVDDGTFNTYAYLVDLEAEGTPCPADFNQDGGVDGADVEAFYQAWEAAEPSADVNQDGGIDGGDVETFFAAWEAGGCF
ncbi:MAG: hypothetical protein JNK25_03075 [Phycisphaerae bacterium]|nr:hypothetical protein [Phycisphaerae bacterium]